MEISLGSFKLKTGRDIDGFVSLGAGLVLLERAVMIFSAFWMMLGADSLIKSVALSAVGATEIDFRMVLFVLFGYGIICAVLGTFALFCFLKAIKNK